MNIEEIVYKIDAMIIKLPYIDRITVLEFINDGYDLTNGHAVCHKLDMHYLVSRSNKSKMIYCHECSKAGGADKPVYHLPPVCAHH